jgi:hypothetical protein
MTLKVVSGKSSDRTAIDKAPRHTTMASVSSISNIVLETDDLIKL